MNPQRLTSYMQEAWDWAPGKHSLIIQGLEEYLTIPNDSPGFDPAWAEHGHMDRAVDSVLATLERLIAAERARGCPVDDIRLEVFGGRETPEKGENAKRRSPLILVEAPAWGESSGKSALLYGHLDKQPGLEGLWSPGLGPRLPIIRDDKLYGRGGADDGYALFSAFSALLALRAQGAPHARCLILIECAEESGSDDLEHYLRALRTRLGDVDMIICLDAGCGDYERMWITSSLRGMAKGFLHVGVLREGVHSGSSSGIVPSPFRVARMLLSRLEEESTGEIRPAALHAPIPDRIRAQAKAAVGTLIKDARALAPFLEGVGPVLDDPAELTLNRTWKPQLTLIGMDGVPPARGAGNVMLPDVTLALSMRLPPTVDAAEANLHMKRLLESDPPYGARVRFEPVESGSGWAAPDLQPWLDQAMRQASVQLFGKPALSMGEGASIPIMKVLAGLFPAAQFLISGVCGPGSNAHGPDEFLHLPAARALSACVALVLAEHAVHA